VPVGGKRVFVTSAAYTAWTVAGKCQAAADSMGLGGSWLPWLSYETSSGSRQNAIDSIMGTGPWYLLDGSVAFANHAQLATTPSVPIQMTERGTLLAASDASVWTGTLTGGQASGADCYAWTDSTNGTIGRADSTDNWTLFASVQGSDTEHIYCFEQ
jgi:hypothetical protein